MGLSSAETRRGSAGTPGRAVRPVLGEWQEPALTVPTTPRAGSTTAPPPTVQLHEKLVKSLVGLGAEKCLVLIQRRVSLADRAR